MADSLDVPVDRDATQDAGCASQEQRLSHASRAKEGGRHMPNVVVLYHSGYGHTKVQAEAVARGAASVEGAKVALVPVEDAELHWDDLHGADAIIFGAPTYMGSVSAKMKAFMELTSSFWRDLRWRNKIAGGFTNSGSQSGDKLNSLTDLVVFAMQHAMIWVGLDLLPGDNHSKGSVGDLNRLGGFLGAMAQSNVDQGPDLAPPTADRDTAEHYGRRIAEVARIWAGRRNTQS
jgi:multimeric flavodoxin WrbA